MINFSSYAEEPDFIVNGPVLSEPYSRLPDFRETPFESKRQKYIEYLDKVTIRLESLLYNIVKNYNPTDIETTNIFYMLDTIRYNNPRILFQYTSDINNSAVCLGLDYVYDFYRNLLNYASRLEGLKTYEEGFIPLFDKFYSVVDQVFNKIGTRGQLYGYTDQEIKTLGNYLESISGSIEQSATWNDARIFIDQELSTFNQNIANFRTNILNAAVDIRSIINPVVKYLNVIKVASDVIQTNWGNYAVTEPMRDTVNKYNKSVYLYPEDFNIQNRGVTSQILEQLRPRIKSDGSNFELILTKSIKIALNKIGVSSLLAQIDSEIIIPNY
jgi:hypothetical protein